MEICLENVCYEYSTKFKSVHAVQNVSHTFLGGKMYAIMGASGSGKTTLLSIMAGLRMPTSGDAFVDGENTKDADCCKLRREKVSVIYQDFNLFQLMTVEENVCYPLVLNGVKKDDAKSLSHTCLAMVGIVPEQYSRMPHMLSGGEQQRVAIARALASGSKIVLADEPTGNLDSTNSINIVDILLKLAHEQHCCVVVVTHDPSIAERADELLTMKDGSFVRP